MDPTDVSILGRLSAKAVRTRALLLAWGLLAVFASASLTTRAAAAASTSHDPCLRPAIIDVPTTMGASDWRLAHNHDWPKSYERERDEPEDEFDLNRTRESEPDVDRPADDRNDLNRPREDQFDLNRGSEADLDLNRPGDDAENDLNR